MAKISKEALFKISEFLSKVLTHSQITDKFHQNGFSYLAENENLNKSKRIYNIFCYELNKTKSFNKVFNFIFNISAPVNFDNQYDHDEFMYSINSILLQESLEIKHANGKNKLLRLSNPLSISDAKERANILLSIIERRNLHPTLMKFCKEQYLQSNYFHAVLEASKSIFKTIQYLTNINLDGHQLIDKAFSTKDPYIALNSLKTQSEISQQVGFINFLKGITSLFRNPTAHEAKINFLIEKEDAIEIFTMISYAHKILDRCFVIKRD